jgi:hypothetical protein
MQERKEQGDLALIGIKISIKIKERLDKEKVHPREPYNEVITRFIDCCDKHKKKN